MKLDQTSRGRMRRQSPGETQVQIKVEVEVVAWTEVQVEVEVRVEVGARTVLVRTPLAEERRLVCQSELGEPIDEVPTNTAHLVADLGRTRMRCRGLGTDHELAPKWPKSVPWCN